MKIKRHLVQIYLLGMLLLVASAGRGHAQVLLGGQGLGVNSNGFGFSVSGATNLAVVVEATTNLTTPLLTFWTPMATNTLSNGFFFFSDPQWTNYARRFYRLTGTNAFAIFTASPAGGPVPLNVQFNTPNFDSLGNPITSWNWNFGDGATSTAQNPSHIYTSLGALNPGFVATNNLGVAMIGAGPQISTLAFAVFTANSTNGATPFAVQFNSPNVDSLGNPITSWDWNFGDGATSTAQNPSHVYTNLGVFNPGFVATNSLGIEVIGSGPQIVAFSFLTATNNGVTAITGYVGKPAGVLTIPAAINGLPVTGISGSAFSGCAGVTSVTIPNTVTGIGLRAFYDCSRLTNVIIPDSVTDIGDYAFSSCGSLSNVVIGNSVTNLGNFAFAFCFGLAGITIPNGVTGIGADAFGYCTGLTSVTIPDSVTCLGDFAFGSCANLTNVVMGSGVTNIGNFAFAFCANLAGVAIPGNVASMGNSAFVACSNLASATVDSGNVGDFAFSSCGSLGSVGFGNDVTNIGNFALAYCPSLTGITIPAQVGSIGVDAFVSCVNLASATINGGSIGDYAFSSCVSLSNVVFGNGVTNIGVGAFAGCSNLTNVTIPGTVSDIGGGAFSSCANLTQVTIGGGVNQPRRRRVFRQLQPPGGLFSGQRAHIFGRRRAFQRRECGRGKNLLPAWNRRLEPAGADRRWKFWGEDKSVWIRCQLQQQPVRHRGSLHEPEPARLAPDGDQSGFVLFRGCTMDEFSRPVLPPPGLRFRRFAGGVVGSGDPNRRRALWRAIESIRLYHHRCRQYPGGRRGLHKSGERHVGSVVLRFADQRFLLFQRPRLDELSGTLLPHQLPVGRSSLRKLTAGTK